VISKSIALFLSWTLVAIGAALVWGVVEPPDSVNPDQLGSLLCAAGGLVGYVLISKMDKEP
jgi:hypothetical protein